MAWYWIVLIVVGYFIMGTFTALMFLVFGEDDEDELMICGVLWPIVLPFLIVIAPFELFYWIIDILKQEIKNKDMGYQCCKMCALSSYKGHFCKHWNRRTSPNRGWCSDIVLKKKYQDKNPRNS